MSDTPGQAASPTVERIYAVLRDHMVTNMMGADGNVGFPLVDLVSNEPPATIATGEEQLGILADAIAEALSAQPQPDPSAERVRELEEAIDLPTMREAFRTTESAPGSRGKVYTMTFRFPSMEAMHRADDEWHAFRQALASTRPNQGAPR